jgi:RND family efflux transporter MFP subunit
LVLLVLSLPLCGCGKPKAETQYTQPVPVTVVSPEPAKSDADGARYPVTVARDREANLSFRVSGAIAALPVRLGDVVAAGAVIARLNATPYAAARVRAEQDVERLSRAAARAHALAPAGAVAPSADEDSMSALRAARAALASARYDEKSAKLQAPFSGVVLSRQAEVGEIVSVGQAVLRLADQHSALLANAAVPAEAATAMRIGMPAQVTFSGRAPIVAVVRRIGAASAPGTGTVEIQLTLPSILSLPSGLTGSVAIGKTGDLMDGSRIPAEALLDAQGAQGHVFVVDPRRQVARRRTVGLLGFDGESLRVTGLLPDAKVITYGAGFVRDGDRIAVARQ